MKIAIFLNSGLTPTREISADIVICADGGYNHCPVTPNYVIGDLDSIDTLPSGIKPVKHDTFPDENQFVKAKTLPNGIQSVKHGTFPDENQFVEPKTLPNGIKIIKHDTHKNFTDGESAVRLAHELGADSVDFFGVLGGRFDHILGNLNIVALAHKLGLKTKVCEDNLDIYFGDKCVEFEAAVGDIISALPHGGDTLVSFAESVEYPLDNLLLTSIDSRGISNVANAIHVKFHIAHGNLLVFHHFKTSKTLQV